MSTLGRMETEGHELVAYFYDKATGLKAIIAVHSTKLGPALGGCRVWPYESEEAALEDVLRLSKGMTYKNAAMGLPLGGGKAVIIADPRKDKTPELFEAFGRAVDSLGGKYITAEDVGTAPEDLLAVRRATEHVVGLPGASGDPSPVTAFGVFSGMKACLEEVFGSDHFTGRTVAVQGLGSVGINLCGYLHEAGAKLIVSDIRQDRVEEAVARFGAQAVEPDAIYDVECDVFAPCALGGVLNDDTIPRLKAKIVAGSANNQLAEDRHGDLLKARGVLYAPDFVINGGGVINVYHELTQDNYDRDRVLERVAHIRDQVAEAIALAKENEVSTAKAALLMAERRLSAS